MAEWRNGGPAQAGLPPLRCGSAGVYRELLRRARSHVAARDALGTLQLPADLRGAPGAGPFRDPAAERPAPDAGHPAALTPAPRDSPGAADRPRAHPAELAPVRLQPGGSHRE